MKHYNTNTTENTPAVVVTNKEVVKPVVIPVSEVSHRDVIEFLQEISQEIKNREPLHTSVADKIDNYIRDHGNRHPKATKQL